jgi:hypothetical protein
VQTPGPGFYRVVLRLAIDSWSNDEGETERRLQSLGDKGAVSWSPSYGGGGLLGNCS